MDVATQRLVRSRAKNRFEYCGLPQDAAPFLTFHIEHIQAGIATEKLLNFNVDERREMRAEIFDAE